MHIRDVVVCCLMENARSSLVYVYGAWAGGSNSRAKALSRSADASRLQSSAATASSSMARLIAFRRRASGIREPSGINQDVRLECCWTGQKADRSVSPKHCNKHRHSYSPLRVDCGTGGLQQEVLPVGGSRTRAWWSNCR